MVVRMWSITRVARPACCPASFGSCGDYGVNRTNRNQRFVVAFIQRYCGDVERGERRDLEHYVELFPEARDAIEREYNALECDESDRTPVGQGGEEDSNAELGSIGRFRLMRVLGSGGQGQVWLAHDQHLNREVALKVLRGGGPGAEQRIQRFRREALVASRLNHAGICPVLDAGVEDGVPYIAMPYIVGRSLAQCIAARVDDESYASWSEFVTVATAPPLADSRTADGAVSDSRDTPSVRESSTTVTRSEIFLLLEIIEKTARALHIAHEAGVVHRDIKPANIMVRRDGEPVIMDFGIARSDHGEEPTLTATGDVFGTPAYMSPEQVEGNRGVGRRSDVYSLAATLFECVTLRTPFESTTREQLYRLILTGKPAIARSLNVHVSRELSIVLETALDRDPDRRYATAVDFADDLSRLRQRTPILARRPAPWTRFGLWVRRNPAVAASLAAVLVSLAGGMISSLVLLDEARDAQSTAERHLGEFEQMSDATMARRLVARERDLWPRRPATLPAMVEWLDEARALVNRADVHLEARDRLREEAGPPTDAVGRADDVTRRELYARLYARLEKARVTVREGDIELERYARERSRLSGKDTPAALRNIEILDRVETVAKTVIDRQRETLREIESDPRFMERLSLGVEDERREWRHEVLVDLVQQIGRIETLIADVEKRRAITESLRATTIEDPRDKWAACLADLQVHASYGGSKELQELGFAKLFETMKPQLGLVPLGRDDESELWEFWMPETGPRPPWKASTNLDGHVDFKGASDEADWGVVLALIPGGRFQMGEPRGSGKGTRLEVPVHEVVLAPYFFAKTELTQGQWMRFNGTNPSMLPAGGRCGRGVDQLVITKRHPVHSISSLDARVTARRLALAIPTEAQWECAARGGTDTTWWTGEEEESFAEERAGNIADRTYFRLTGQRSGPRYDDKYGGTAPVGRFTENDFGLYDVLGNLDECCRDRFGPYSGAVAIGDGARQGALHGDWIVRGGSYQDRPSECRVAARNSVGADQISPYIGIRLARSLDGSRP